jgi:ferredoxin
MYSIDKTFTSSYTALDHRRFFMPTPPDNIKLPEKNDYAVKTTGTIRHIVVDRAKCIGARSCVAVTPGVFQMDEENLAYIVDPDSADDDTLLMSAQSCPVLAILLYDEHGKQIFPEE